MDYSASSMRPTLDTPSIPKTVRKYWTRAEEDALIDAVKELIIEGWQSGNGWRPGFNGQVARRIVAKVPDSDVRGDPHVISKMASWGRDYRALAKLFDRSGNNAIALDPIDHTISIVDSEVWGAAVKVNSDLLKMKTKPFPYWDDWEEIFGNSRGVGDKAVDFGATRKRVRNQKKNQPPVATPETPTGFEDLTGENGDATSTGVESQAGEAWKPSGIKKRKERSNGVDEEIVDSISVALAETKTAIVDLSGAIRSLKEVDPAVKKVFSTIQGLGEFNMTTIVRAAKKIVASQMHVALFFSMDEVGKKEYVRSILAE